MIEQTLNGEWKFRKIGETEWLPATVPGGVHTDLLALGRIPDPFTADHELEVQWVAESDWEYWRIFTVDTSLREMPRLFLVCDGLDTIAEVVLNGQSLGHTENMFLGYRWEINSLVQPGENELVIRFASPVCYTQQRYAQRPLPGVSDVHLPGGAYLRKAPSHFGWDWGPKLPPIGIWREIRLEAGDIARIEDVQLLQQHQDSKVTLDVLIKAEVWDDRQLSAELQVTSPDGQVQSTTTSLHQGKAALVLSIENPKLWWPNGLGEQAIYQVQVSLQSGNKILDQRDYQIGLRTIELRQHPDEFGVSFTFVVNGVPVFAKGANWIPCDSFPTRVTPEQLDHLIKSSAEANFNMLRCWGGGYYEEDVFFELCDRYGILVWQDFMFSCAAYPFTDANFLKSVHEEVIYNIRRLRHHACLALWCGNNEMESGWIGWGWNTPQNSDLKEADIQFFYHTLREWVKTEDPTRPYWPSSPSSNTPHENPNSNQMGDNHLWEVWHGLQPFTFYNSVYPRFASEFGFQSFPALTTIATYAQPSEWNLTSYIMEHHQRSYRGNGLIIAYLTNYFRMPKDFTSTVYLSQVLQAEAMRMAVEGWRRNRQRCSGALYWQLNDCWPVASWSSIDHFGRWKALQYAARRFFEPVHLSIEVNDSTAALFLTNDQTEVWRGELHWSLESVDGAVLSNGTESVSAVPLGTTPVKTLDFLGSHKALRQTVLVAELWQDGEQVAQQVCPFVPDKHLAFADPQLNAAIGRRDGMLHIAITTGSLARFIELNLEGADVIFSDNYFDLPAGRSTTVTCQLPKNWEGAQAAKNLRMRSLYNSYE